MGFLEALKKLVGVLKLFRREGGSIEEEASVIREGSALETALEGNLGKVTVGETDWIRIDKRCAELEEGQFLLDRLSEELVARYHGALDLGATCV